MERYSHIAVGLIPAVIFFLGVPLAGAFSVRQRWRRFRKAVRRASTLPRIDDAFAQTAIDSAPPREHVVVFGRLEGVEGKSGIWLRSLGFSVSVDLETIPLFLLPPRTGTGGSPPDVTPRIAYWKEMNALVEGTKFLVAGETRRGPSGTFSIEEFSDTGEKPLIIMYDGPDDDVFSRAMWTGRQRNEYWNHYTPISLIVGFLAELLWVVHVFDENRLYALIGIVLAVLPVLPLIPPGLIGFYIFRKLWQSGRRLRAIRDVAILGGEGGTGNSDARRYTQDASFRESLGTAAFLAGLAVNAYIGALILAVLLR